MHRILKRLRYFWSVLDQFKMSVRQKQARASHLFVSITNKFTLHRARKIWISISWKQTTKAILWLEICMAAKSETLCSQTCEQAPQKSNNPNLHCSVYAYVHLYGHVLARR